MLSTAKLTEGEMKAVFALGDVDGDGQVSFSEYARMLIPVADEKICQQWMRSEFLQGGIEALYTPNPFDDEKGELPSHNSAAVTPLSETDQNPSISLGYDSDLSGSVIIQGWVHLKKDDFSHSEEHWMLFNS